MTTTHQLATPAATSAAEVAEYLATGYIALNCAAITAEQLIATDTLYCGTTGWDLELAILDAVTAVENAVCVHDLAQHHGFWKNPHIPHLALTVLASHHAPGPQATAHWLVVELTAAFTHLTHAASHAEALIAIDHCYHHQYGYVGGLGWDLETAVDDAIIAIRDAIIAIRDAIRTGDLASLDPQFWANKL
ncbi:hypothetical protein [Mycolicibacterium mageritense]|uniref:hypothetical protein n=1 Tax=Mycolicibacterium mageritense TaxID=53462 RepID=UPI0011D7E3BD|nr:hypothetical protein [Mycolicibacterium mageritense]TXI59033.1 MAG: hypothetical protein E6Q55_22350 [Mycolicibacterium mageritense]